MLHPKNNRIDYGEQLIPPDGYELTKAIGTTYSLDLETLMVLPVALFYSQLLDENADKLRFDMLESITRAAEKITVFYQSGQLKVPHKYHHLMAYWEKGIVPVRMDNHVSSFHPKVWIVRYDSKKNPSIYRVLVTSRNMVNNRDWDVAFSSDGVVQEKDEHRNVPLVHFLEYLNLMGGYIPNNFISDLSKAKFDLPHLFNKLQFIPVGIPNSLKSRSYVNPLTSSKSIFDEMLIVSPFVDKKTLETLTQNVAGKRILLSRKDEMDCIDENTLRNFNNWQFSKYIEKAEHSPELEEGVEAVDQNLHAKLFIAEKDQTTFWYLGSANCTDPAQGRNIEFMIQLSSDKPAIGAKQILKLLTNEKGGDVCIFTPYNYADRQSSDEQKRIDLDIRKIKYDLSCLEINGQAKQIAGGTAYDLIIDFDLSLISLPEGYDISVKPLPEKNKTPRKLKQNILNRIDDFTGYPETLLSPFIEVQIWKGDMQCSIFVLIMNIDLPESRLNKIFTSIIDSRDKFLKYLTFLLTGEDTEVISHSTAKTAASVSADEGFIFNDTPVFEKMLIAASRFPGKLESINHLIARIKSESQNLEVPIISPEFDDFWTVFQDYLKTHKA